MPTGRKGPGGNRRDPARKPQPAAAAPAIPSPAPLIAVLFGLTAIPFVTTTVRAICRGGDRHGVDVLPLAIEEAVQHPARCARVGRLYVLPFDLPPGVTDSPKNFVRRLFPHAEIVNPMEAHELCWDRITTAERLLTRGVPVPESLYTSAPEEARAFVARHQFVVLRERRSGGGQGDVVLCDAGDVLAGEAGGRRFVVEMSADPSARRHIDHGVLTYPPPFFLQRIIGDAGRRGAFVPGQALRAYIVDGHIVFWTERFRDRYQRPSDWLLRVALGAKYRFVLETSEEMRKAALRAAEVLGVRIGTVDLTRTGSAGPYVLEVNTDGYHQYIDRQFKDIPDYRAPFDFDHFVGGSLAGVPEEARRVVHVV